MPYFHFNPHSREGSDTLERICHATVGDFNPHSREGSDTGVEEKLEGYAISIHTPAKGVTFDGVTGWAGIMHFNPHSREGSDTIENKCFHSQTAFQSTLPRRE